MASLSCDLALLKRSFRFCHDRSVSDASSSSRSTARSLSTSSKPFCRACPQHITPSILSEQLTSRTITALGSLCLPSWVDQQHDRNNRIEQSPYRIQTGGCHPFSPPLGSTSQLSTTSTVSQRVWFCVDKDPARSLSVSQACAYQQPGPRLCCRLCREWKSSVG
jgi:hypothetical protein